MYMPVTQLHPRIQAYLKETVRYHRPDISVEAREAVVLANSGGDGRKAFAIVANLDTGECHITWGSWGGPNPFNLNNRVDLDQTPHTIPLNGAVIEGSISSKATYASMSVHPDNLPKLLPQPATLEEHDLAVLRAYHHIRAGSYRKEALARIPDAQKRIDRLAERGLLKKNKAGAAQITTEGKNALS